MVVGDSDRGSVYPDIGCDRFPDDTQDSLLRLEEGVLELHQQLR
ncbi:hypothetical protein VB711_04135 [Cronbergia sp. UHCC 0137]|nr:hypothetical protein [Cronbergia sp. UHCC 0137]MEA5617034.1 hypothetical protein [Cronbergia sp. UHCC 0137]